MVVLRLCILSTIPSLKKRCDQYSLDVFLSAYVIGMREITTSHQSFTTEANPYCKRRAYALFRDLVSDAASIGYGKHTTHLICKVQSPTLIIRVIIH